MVQSSGWQIIDRYLRNERDALIESLIKKEDGTVRAKIYGIDYLYTVINDIEINAAIEKQGE